MNARGVNALAGVIHAAMQTHRTAAGIAMAVEAAGMVQSPETAAELVALRSRVEELEQQLADARAERADRHDDLAGALGYSGEDWADLISIAAANTAAIARGGAR